MGSLVTFPSPERNPRKLSYEVFLPLLHTVQQDKDTMCIPCPRGYFSKVASSTDECKSWTK